MGDKLTRIRLPGLPNREGFMDWGEHQPSVMISAMRRRAAHMREVADAIDAASDEDFEIAVIRGPCVQHMVRMVQAGKS